MRRTFGYRFRSRRNTRAVDSYVYGFMLVFDLIQSGGNACRIAHIGFDEHTTKLCRPSGTCGFVHVQNHQFGAGVSQGRRGSRPQAQRGAANRKAPGAQTLSGPDPGLSLSANLPAGRLPDDDPVCPGGHDRCAQRAVSSEARQVGIPRFLEHVLCFTFPVLIAADGWDHPRVKLRPLFRQREGFLCNLDGCVDNLGSRIVLVLRRDPGRPVGAELLFPERRPALQPGRLLPGAARCHGHRTVIRCLFHL